jgi:hypothetical protein
MKSIAGFAIFFSILVWGVNSSAFERPQDMEKARNAGLGLNPPLDVDALFQEAEDLGVECLGDLTARFRLEICRNRVEAARSRGEAARNLEDAARIEEEATQALIQFQKELGEEEPSGKP